MRKIPFLASILLMLSCSWSLEPYSGLADCDLVFVVSSAGAGKMDDAIAESTCGDGLNVTHVGILEVADDSVFVIDATPKYGVCRRSLDSFRAECAEDSSSAGEIVMRLQNLMNASDVLARAKSYLGRKYDFAYLPDNEDIYCSELVQFSFLDENGAPVFKGHPMNFRGPDGNIPEFWIKLFEGLGMPVPEGIEGTNPHDMLGSDCLQYVLTLDGDCAWGDQGNGKYVNPVLCADYSDPDVIRVGEKYYMVASDFHYVGMQILESGDMVNWNLAAQLYDRFNLPGWDGNNHYAGGSWAPAIRFHDGLFFVYFCTPEEGLFMTSAEDPHGPWSPLHQVKAVPRWEDPCPLWDDNGDAYLLHSRKGAGPIILHRMSRDGRELLDEGVTIYEGPTAEGPKFLRKDGWYYISLPEGGVKRGWQTVLRSKNLYGPYERKIVLEQGPTSVNGPHQGSLVDTPEGVWWFYHFQEKSPLGRVVHLQPASWEDGWPVIGVDVDGNGVGNPVGSWDCPSGSSERQVVPATSDDFEDGLGLQWQFCHNPHDGFWSVEDGRLSIKAQQSESLRMAHNILTQKTMGWRGSATVELDLSSMSDGQRAGLASMGGLFFSIGVLKENGVLFLYQTRDGEEVILEQYDSDSICLGLKYDARCNLFQFSEGSDVRHLELSGPAFSQKNGFWKGCRIGLYTYNVSEDSGTICFDNFSC